MKAHLRYKMMKLMRKHCFSYNISNLVICTNMENLQNTLIKSFSNKMAIILNVFCSLMKHMVSSYVNGGCTIREQYQFLQPRNLQVIDQPNHFLHSLRQRSVLCFCRRTWYCILLLWPPWDQRVSKKHRQAYCWSFTITARGPISISKSL